MVTIAAVGVACVAVGYVVITRRHDEPPPRAIAAPVAVPAIVPTDAAAATASANPFVRIDPPPTPVELGVGSNAPAAEHGFRPARHVMAPTSPYELQAHEVTWGEIDPWLKAHPEEAPTIPVWARDPATRAQLPTTGLTWSAALEYCRSLGASLPTESQWEYAARGPELRLRNP